VVPDAPASKMVFDVVSVLHQRGTLALYMDDFGVYEAQSASYWVLIEMRTVMRPHALCFTLFMVLITATLSAAQRHSYNDDAVLKYAKSIDVAKLDSTLAPQRLEDWLLRGPARIDELYWSISQACDLKDPEPDADGDLPLCVKLGFRRGNATGFGVLRVGTLKHGVGGQPAFQYLDVLRPFSVGSYDKLSEFPRFLDGIPQFGTICVLPIAPELETKGLSAGDHITATLRLRIDKRHELPWPHNQPVKIEPLSLSDRHVVVVTSKNKQVQSFRFDFVDYSDAKLCLVFDGSKLAYLGSSRSASWCSCK